MAAAARNAVWVRGGQASGRGQHQGVGCGAVVHQQLGGGAEVLREGKGGIGWGRCRERGGERKTGSRQAGLRNRDGRLGSKWRRVPDPGELALEDRPGQALGQAVDKPENHVGQLQANCRQPCPCHQGGPHLEGCVAQEVGDAAGEDVCRGQPGGGTAWAPARALQVGTTRATRHSPCITWQARRSPHAATQGQEAALRPGARPTSSALLRLTRILLDLPHQLALVVHASPRHVAPAAAAPA